MILRKHWINDVKALRTGYTDAEIEAMSTDKLLEIINTHDTITESQLKAELSQALNEFENCLTTAGLDEIYNAHPHLHTNAAFTKAYEIAIENLKDLKI